MSFDIKIIQRLTNLTNAHFYIRIYNIYENWQKVNIKYYSLLIEAIFVSRIPMIKNELIKSFRVLNIFLEIFKYRYIN